MKPLLVLNVVGLTRGLLQRFEKRAPALSALAREGRAAAVSSVLPAVTCSVQATYLTGTLPQEHGIVANGWYDRERAEINFWQQSNYLMHGEKIWETGKKRDRNFTSAQLFWWFNMYSTNDVAVTPRPAHLENDAVLSLTYTKPPELAEVLDTELGRFPLFDFWGPRAGIRSSQWIEQAALHVLHRYSPTLTLVYLPHLDYNLQRLGPHDDRLGDDVAAVDAIVGRLLEAARAGGREVVVLSEYGMTSVSGAVHLNRVLRGAGFLRAQKQHTWELLDPGASRAFAVCDHQFAHIYVRDPEDLSAVRETLEKTAGVARVLGADELDEAGLAHPRAGDLAALSAPDRWFSYYYWEEAERAPSWTREVDIHRKPGYDPLELFMNPRAPLKIPRIMWRLLKRTLGFRTTIMDFVPYDVELVRGSHGLPPADDEEAPVFMTSAETPPLPEKIAATEIRERLLQIIFA